MVHLEIDGSVHLNVDVWWEDMDRQTDLAIAEDALVVRIAAAALRSDPFDVAKRLSRALGVPLMGTPVRRSVQRAGRCA